MERNAAVLHVAMTFEQRHKGNEKASSADISGGRAFEADKIAQVRTCWSCLSSYKGTLRLAGSGRESKVGGGVGPETE